jgi:hypothetical protein
MKIKPETAKRLLRLGGSIVIAWVWITLAYQYYRVAPLEIQYRQLMEKMDPTWSVHTKYLWNAPAGTTAHN